MSDITLAQGTARGPLAELAGAGITVPLVQGGQARYVNLDYAASAPSLAQVVARVAEVLTLVRNVHRGSGYLSLVSTALYESARATVRQFVGARGDDVDHLHQLPTGSNLLVQAVPSATPSSTSTSNTTPTSSRGNGISTTACVPVPLGPKRRCAWSRRWSNTRALFWPSRAPRT